MVWMVLKGDLLLLAFGAGALQGIFLCLLRFLPLCRADYQTERLERLNGVRSQSPPLLVTVSSFPSRRYWETKATVASAAQEGSPCTAPF